MEVIIAITIVALMAAIAVPSYFYVVQSANEKAAKVQIKSFETSMQHYLLAPGTYPATLEDLVTNVSGVKNWKGPYLQGGKVPNDPWGAPYLFMNPGQHSPIDISSSGRDRQQNTEDDISNYSN